MTIKATLGSAAIALLLAGTSALAQSPIKIGHLADYSGGTSDVGTPYGHAIVDTFNWINKNGGINGTKVDLDSTDYGYQVPRAIAQYKKWTGSDKISALIGWGTADTEALTGFLAKDKIPDISGSYAAALSDPTGASGKAKAAPYNFFYGPTYSDALRAELNRLRGLLGSAPAYDDYADDDDDENIDAWVFVVLIVAILVCGCLCLAELFFARPRLRRLLEII